MARPISPLRSRARALRPRRTQNQTANRKEAMNQTELITVILGLVAVVVPLALSIMAAFMSHTHRKQVDELAWAIISVTETLKGQADRALAPYGPQLQPLHNALA